MTYLKREAFLRHEDDCSAVPYCARIRRTKIDCIILCALFSEMDYTVPLSFLAEQALFSFFQLL